MSSNQTTQALTSPTTTGNYYTPPRVTVSSESLGIDFGWDALQGRYMQADPRRVMPAPQTNSVSFIEQRLADERNITFHTDAVDGNDIYQGITTSSM